MINLVFDKYYEGVPTPNGLLRKYFSEWIQYDWKHPHQFNVLTCFFNSAKLKLGFFPLLIKESGFKHKYVSISNIRPDDINWLVIEPSSIDKSFVIENCITALSDEALGAVRQQAVSLIIYFAYEAFPFEYREFMSTLERSLAFWKIPPKNIVLVFGDNNIQFNYEEYSSHYFVYFPWETTHLVNFNHFEFEFRLFIDEILKSKKECQKQILYPTDDLRFRRRDHVFLCLNAGARKHRRYIIAELYRRNIAEHGLISYLNKYFEDITQTIYINKVEGNEEKIKYHQEWEISPRQILLDNDQAEGYWHNRGMVAQHYADTYFSIITETFPDRPAYFMTEKVFKPILNLHPFIVTGGIGILSKLRLLGYETFPELFDEEYDEIQEDGIRFDHILEQVHQISLNKNKLHEKYTQIWPKLCANRDKLMNKNFRNETKELVKTLLQLTQQPT